MKIFRVQHKDLTSGPYTPDQWFEEFCDCDAPMVCPEDMPYLDGHDDNCMWSRMMILAQTMRNSHGDAGHPTPWFDVPGGISYHEVCGFISLDCLNEWFEGFLAPMDLCDYIIAVFEVDDFRYSSNTGQAVFTPPAVPLDTLPLV